MEKVQKPSNSECDAPSSEPFRIYLRVARLYSEIVLSRKPLGIGHMYIYSFP
jgi:hypothetical protein